MNNRSFALAFPFILILIIVAAALVIVQNYGWQAAPPPVPAIATYAPPSNSAVPREPQPSRTNVATAERTDGLPDGSVIRASNPTSIILGFTLTGSRYGGDMNIRSMWFMPTPEGTLSTMRDIDSLKLYDENWKLIAKETIDHSTISPLGVQMSMSERIFAGSKKSFWLTADVRDESVGAYCASSTRLQFALIDARATDSHYEEVVFFRLPGLVELSATNTVSSAIFKVLP